MQDSELQNSAMQYCTIQYIAVQCSTVQCSSVQCSVVQYSTVQCSAVQCSAVECSAVQCSAVQCSRMQCSQDWLWGRRAVTGRWFPHWGGAETLHCTALHFTALHCTVLYSTALYCTALHYTVLYCPAIYATHCNVLLCKVPKCLQDNKRGSGVRKKYMLYFCLKLESSIWNTICSVQLQWRMECTFGLWSVKCML